MYNNFGHAIVIGGFITAFVLNGVAAYTGGGGPCCPDEVRRLREAEGHLFPDDNNNGRDAINQNNRHLECYCLGTESTVVNDEACPDCRSTSPTNVPTKSPVTSDPTGAPVTLDPTNTPTESPESTNPTQSPESTSTTTTTTTEATTTTTTKATSTTTPEATTTTTSTTTSDGEDPDKPTLHDAIDSLSKCIHSSSHWNPQTYKAHWAKLVLILADKNDIMDLKVTKAEYAATVLGCPEVGGCYGSVCEEIDDAVSALGDEPIRERKLRGNLEDIMDCDPWVYPASDKANLLAKDPGIWTIENFLTEEEVDKLTKIYLGYEETIAGEDFPCSKSQDAKDSKRCVLLSADDLLNNHHNKEDNEFFMQILGKVMSLWPQFKPVEKSFVYDVPKGEHPPLQYHWHTYENESRSRVSSTGIFLTDDDGEGAGFIFPFAGSDGLYVPPKKGMALTWLNVHEDGTFNKNHVHGVQGTTPQSERKLAFAQDYFVDSVDVLLNRDDRSRTCRNLKGVP